MCATRKDITDKVCEPIKQPDLMAMIHARIEQLAAKYHLDKLATDIKSSYNDVFELIPHVNRMPDSVQCKITLKDAHKAITTQPYSCPQKFHEDNQQAS
jgi:hypothetical protein